MYKNVINTTIAISLVLLAWNSFQIVDRLDEIKEILAAMVNAL